MSEKLSGLTPDNLPQAKDAGIKALYPDKIRITVGMASCGLAAGAGKVFNALEKAIAANSADIELVSTGCPGFCQMEPLVTVRKQGGSRVMYSNFLADKAEEFVAKTAAGELYEDNLLCRMDDDEDLICDSAMALNSSSTDGSVPLMSELPFFGRQKRIVLRNCGIIDPSNINEYIARGGYIAIAKALTSMKPEDVIEELKKSGLRGRGGAGFPTGLKWEFCRKAAGDTKYIVCNADEGDPGAYMDRSVLEGDPHSVLEGMMIGAYAIGAERGIIYVRTEYPLAIERLKTAIAQAEERGLLGKGIMGSGFNLEVSIREGAGAFVCGEETSLIASIEGTQPEPRPRPPFPAQSGLWGCPTNINNVETWPNVPVIIARGGDWFANIGSEKSKGTKVFSLVGAVKNTGLIEVPMGTTLKDIVYNMGGGIAGDKKLKAVQTGGPSGGCIPAEHIDLPVDFENLSKVGSIMGSGGMVVMDEDNCMVDIAKFFTSFTREESCGKCTSCRDGLDAAYALLDKITKGIATDDDLDLLEDLAKTIGAASQCGLGKTAPNPVLSTLKYFKDEYIAHIHDKTCSAKVCKALFNYHVIEEKCIGCGKCNKACNYGAITGEIKEKHIIDKDKCIKCGACMAVCPVDAIEKIS